MGWDRKVGGAGLLGPYPLFAGRLNARRRLGGAAREPQMADGTRKEAALRTILVDDEPLALQRLQMFFRDIEGANVVATARGGREAVEAIRTLGPDLVLLDVQMPEQSGLWVAEELARAAESHGSPEVIFVSASDNYADQAAELEAVDYLLKPVRQDRLRQAVARARRRRALRAGTGPGAACQCDLEHSGLCVETRDGPLHVPMASIDWIETAGHYAMIRTATHSHMVRTPIEEIARRIDPEHLIRVHRSAIVCPDAVARVERHGAAIHALELKDGATVAVGPLFADAVAMRLEPVLV